METHPDKIIDFRFDVPFDELTHYISNINLKKMDATEASHVPFPILILKALEQWKNSVS